MVTTWCSLCQHQNYVCIQSSFRYRSGQTDMRDKSGMTSSGRGDMKCLTVYTKVKINNTIPGGKH